MPPVDDGDNSPVPWLMSKGNKVFPYLPVGNKAPDRQLCVAGQDNRAYVVDSDDNDVVDGRKIRKASREPIQVQATLLSPGWKSTLSPFFS